MPLDFLLQIPLFRLPHKVTSPEEMRFVCVLTSTGLIESESWPRLGMTDRFLPVKYVWIERITAEGYAEIATIELQALQRADSTLGIKYQTSGHAGDLKHALQPHRTSAHDTGRVPHTTWIAACT